MQGRGPRRPPYKRRLTGIYKGYKVEGSGDLASSYVLEVYNYNYHSTQVGSHLEHG